MAGVRLGHGLLRTPGPTHGTTRAGHRRRARPAPPLKTLSANAGVSRFSDTIGSGLFNDAGTVLTAFPIPFAGSYTIYLNAQMYFGESSSDLVANAETVAVFYPG